MKQVILDSSEFAYLLHMLDATRVVGVKNSELFPTDAEAEKALLQQGFETLQAHGWLVADEEGFRTHTGVVLLTAVIASPEIAILLTLAAPDGGKQFVTYYLAQDMVVEQMLTAEQQYLLTKLDDFNEVVVRLEQALAIAHVAPPLSTPVSLPRVAFEEAFRQRENGRLSALQTLLHAADDGLQEIDDVPSLARLLQSLRPVGSVEIGHMAGGRLIGRRDIMFFRDGDNNRWAMTRNAETDHLIFHPLTPADFAALLIETAMNKNAAVPVSEIA